jgi:hypothetical protein
VNISFPAGLFDIRNTADSSAVWFSFSQGNCANEPVRALRSNNIDTFEFEKNMMGKFGFTPANNPTVIIICLDD